MARIILTGGNEGIGFHMTSQFLKDGHMVAVLDLNLDHLRLLKETYPDTLLPFECDVGNPQMVMQNASDAIIALGGIDYAIHNACQVPEY